MPDFDESFLNYCDWTEKRRKNSYSLNSNPAGLPNGGSQRNLVAVAKNYSKTLPRSFRKNLLRLYQIRSCDSNETSTDLVGSFINLAGSEIAANHSNDPNQWASVGGIRGPVDKVPSSPGDQSNDNNDDDDNDDGCKC